jgi:peptidoglycan hydrolase CwlO-like protein
VSLLLICIAGVFFFLNQDKLISVKSKIDEELDKKALASRELESDQNESSKLLNGLFRQRGDLRMKARDLVSSTETLVQEIDFLTTKPPELEEKSVAFEVDLGKLKKELIEQQKKIDTRNAEFGPTLQKVESLNAELEKLQGSLAEKTKEKNSLSTEIAALETKRRVAEESFVERKKNLLSDIQKPPFIYYGDEVEVTIENISPSGNGIFISSGKEAGFRESMVFLASLGSGSNRKIFFMNTSLVQDNLTFFELMDPDKNVENNLFDDFEKVLLSRSGKLSKE